jgi:hypothetical protein
VDEILDPKLKEVAKRVFTTFRLAAEKAVLNYSDEANYPIPADPNSVEQLFRKQFTREGYREETRQAALELVFCKLRRGPSGL